MPNQTQHRPLAVELSVHQHVLEVKPVEPIRLQSQQPQNLDQRPRKNLPLRIPRVRNPRKRRTFTTLVDASGRTVKMSMLRDTLPEFEPESEEVWAGQNINVFTV